MNTPMLQYNLQSSAMFVNKFFRKFTKWRVIDGKACKNIPEAVHKLVLSACLGHSWEIGCNKHDSSYYSKQNSVYITG